METPAPDESPPSRFRSPDPDSTPLSRSDIRLRERAIRGNWDIPEELVTETIFQAHEILRDQYADDKLKTRVMSLLNAAKRSDQHNGRLDLDKSKLTPPAEPTCRDALLRRAEAIVAESKGTS